MYAVFFHLTHPDASQDFYMILLEGFGPSGIKLRWEMMYTPDSAPEGSYFILDRICQVMDKKAFPIGRKTAKGKFPKLELDTFKPQV